MDRLSPLDAAFLEAEDADRHTSMAIASIALFDGPAPGHDELLAAFESRLPLLPRYRQRVARAPWDLGAPVWVDCSDFDLGYHVRRTALPAPGGDEELFALMARLMGQRLDRDRPLWEAWVVEGLPDGRWAMVSKVHHCMVDGIAGTELYHLLLSTSPDDDVMPDVPALPAAEPSPSVLRLTASGVTQTLLSPARQLALVAAAARRPLDAATRVATTARGLLALSTAVLPAASSSLLGEIGQQRRYAATTVVLPDVKRIGRHFGVTVNDVVLSAITGGFRALLLARGEPCDAHALRSLVPASVRPPGAEGALANQVSCMLPYLPVHIEDPVQRLQVVHETIRLAKEHHEMEAGDALVRLSGYQPFGAVSAFLRSAFRVPQRNIVTVTTNVPGPRIPYYLLGRRLRRLLPFVPIADRVRIGVAILSYCDEISFGVTADYDTGADISLLLEATRHDIELLAAAAAPTAVTG